MILNIDIANYVYSNIEIMWKENMKACPSSLPISHMPYPSILASYSRVTRTLPLFLRYVPLFSNAVDPVI